MDIISISLALVALFCSIFTLLIVIGIIEIKKDVPSKRDPYFEYKDPVTGLLGRKKVHDKS